MKPFNFDENDEDLFAPILGEALPVQRKSIGATGGWGDEPVKATKDADKPLSVKARKLMDSEKGPGAPFPENRPEPIPEPILKKLEVDQPDLVARYRARMAESDQGLKGAEKIQDYASMANVFGKAANDYNNSQKSDTVLDNNFHSLGRAPSILKADRPDYDSATSDRLSQQGVDRAKASRSESESQFMNEEKLTDLGTQREDQALQRSDQKTARDRAERMLDPNSPESAAARQSLQEMAPKFASGKDFSKMSAAMIEKIAPQAFQASQQIQSQEFQAGENAKNRGAQAALFNQKRDYDKTKEKAPGSPQYLAAGYGKRLAQSLDVLDKLKNEGYNRADISAGLGSKLPNVMKSTQSQQQEQAERNFINAVLRRESGAAIAESEFSNAETQYFPRAGDSAEVLEQKEANRQQVMNSFKAESGSAWDRVETAPSGGKPSTGASGSFDWDAEDKRRGLKK